MQILLLIALYCGPSRARGQLEIAGGKERLAVFGGRNCIIPLTIRNTTQTLQQSDVTARLFQTSSATAVLMTNVGWKTIQVLPSQKVLESAQINFPSVRAETRFLIQWVDDTNRIIGKTEVLVYPTNLLTELKTLAGEEPLGVFDPDEKLKPLLKNLDLEFTDLENAGLRNFIGKLAIIGPFSSKAQMREGLADDIAKLARKGRAIVWILPSPEPRDELLPSFFPVPQGAGCVVVAHADLVSNLAENPSAQLNLLHFARLALRPEPPRLPQITQR